MLTYCLQVGTRYALLACKENLHQVLVQEASLLITCALTNINAIGKIVVYMEIHRMIHKVLKVRSSQCQSNNCFITYKKELIHDLARGRKWRKSLSRGLSRLIKVKLCTEDDHHNILYQMHQE